MPKNQQNMMSRTLVMQLYLWMSFILSVCVHFFGGFLEDSSRRILIFFFSGLKVSPREFTGGDWYCSSFDYQSSEATNGGFSSSLLIWFSGFIFLLIFPFQKTIQTPSTSSRSIVSKITKRNWMNTQMIQQRPFVTLWGFFIVLLAF